MKSEATAFDMGNISDSLSEAVRQPARSANVSSVFGKPYEIDGKTIIPVVKVRYVFGFSAGGSGKRDALDRSGAGGRMKARGIEGVLSSVKPVAVIEVDGGKVSIKPVPDILPLALAGMALGGWNLYWILKTIRHWRAMR